MVVVILVVVVVEVAVVVVGAVVVVAVVVLSIAGVVVFCSHRSTNSCISNHRNACRNIFK